VRKVLALRWRPGRDTALALATALVMVGSYYINAQARNATWTLVVFVGLTNGLLNVLLPAWYVLRVRRERPEALGLTGRWWWLAGLISLGIAAANWPRLLAQAALRPDVDLAAHVLTNGAVFWEPFFVHGWLQLRFERAFGVIPGIVLAAVCFAAYHLGTYPLPVVLNFGLAVLALGALFRVTGNLLTVWPLTWAVTSAIGTLRNPNLSFDGSALAVRAALLAVQLAVIGWLIWSQRRPPVAAGSGHSAPAAV